MVEVLVHGGPLGGQRIEFEGDEPPAEWTPRSGHRFFDYRRTRSLINAELRWVFVPRGKKGLEK